MNGKVMKKILLILLCLQAEIGLASSHRYGLLKKVVAGAVTLGTSGYGLYEVQEYKRNQVELERTQETFRSLGVRYMNDVEPRDQFARKSIALTQDLYQEIGSFIEESDVSNIKNGLINLDHLVKVKKTFLASDDLGLRKDLKVVHINDQKGYGVIATHDIPAHTSIGVYAGELCHHLDIDNHDYAFDSLYAYRRLDGGVVIRELQVDARYAGNITRFINGSDSTQQANCMVYIIMDRNKKPQNVFATNRLVKAGEELTIDYGPKYEWKS